MEVKVGVIHNPKELEVETGQSADEVAALVDAAVSGRAQVLWLVDTKGRRVGVPVEKLAYVEIGEEDQERAVGFGARR